jgi:RNA polymerase sigma-70 factor (ECF subfamily)
MKITYQFANETAEIDVSEEWGAVILDFDRRDYNTNQRETRRHCSLDAYNLDDALLPSATNIENEYIFAEQSDELRAAVAMLSAEQQTLIRKIFLEKQKIVDIARVDGVSEAAVRNRLKKIYARLKKILI